MSRKALDLPPIIIDTRENLPFRFDGLATERGTLPSGDYSLKGCEHLVAVERKSKADAWGSIAGERERFARCIERLAALDRAAIVIECSLADFCVRPERIQRVTIATAVGSYVSWSVQYQLPVFWCDNRRYAERVALRFLASWWKHRSVLRQAGRKPEVATTEAHRPECQRQMRGVEEYDEQPKQ